MERETYERVSGISIDIRFASSVVSSNVQIVRGRSDGSVRVVGQRLYEVCAEISTKDAHMKRRFSILSN